MELSLANCGSTLTKRQTQRLVQKASDYAAEATAVLEQAITLREAMYAIFAAVAHGRQPKASDLVTSNSGGQSPVDILAGIGYPHST